MNEIRNISITRNDASGRYHITVDGQEAGFVAFEQSDTHIAFTHTELLDAFQGQGVGSRLAAEALADAASQGLTIIPLCPYMARYLERHPIDGARIDWPTSPPRS
ncbi:GNAT family N-acetyltransferase [Demequina sp.]|uniref:GNAT family N-acetyltransferase n=1 Tax=Demequina sp. TaxID=2050685 RepID=UPI0025B94137|nr:GNAT family N-acetyltransferase [Demequina sp.]